MRNAKPTPAQARDLVKRAAKLALHRPDPEEPIVNVRRLRQAERLWQRALDVLVDQRMHEMEEYQRKREERRRA